MQANETQVIDQLRDRLEQLSIQLTAALFDARSVIKTLATRLEAAEGPKPAPQEAPAPQAE